jgi:hypothetical protein
MMPLISLNTILLNHSPSCIRLGTDMQMAYKIYCYGKLQVLNNVNIIKTKVHILQV